MTHKVPFLAGRTLCRWWIIHRRGRGIEPRRWIVPGWCVVVSRRLVIYRRWIKCWGRDEHRKAEADKDARMSWSWHSHETENSAEHRNRQRTADATFRCSVHAPTLRFQCCCIVTGRPPRRSTVCALFEKSASVLWSPRGMCARRQRGTVREGPSPEGLRHVTLAGQAANGGGGEVSLGPIEVSPRSLGFDRSHAASHASRPVGEPPWRPTRAPPTIPFRRR